MLSDASVRTDSVLFPQQPFRSQYCVTGSGYIMKSPSALVVGTIVSIVSFLAILGLSTVIYKQLERSQTQTEANRHADDDHLTNKKSLAGSSESKSDHRQATRRPVAQFQTPKLDENRHSNWVPIKDENTDQAANDAAVASTVPRLPVLESSFRNNADTKTLPVVSASSSNSTSPKESVTVVEAESIEEDLAPQFDPLSDVHLMETTEDLAVLDSSETTDALTALIERPEFESATDVDPAAHFPLGNPDQPAADKEGYFDLTESTNQVSSQQSEEARQWLMNLNSSETQPVSIGTQFESTQFEGLSDEELIANDQHLSTDPVATANDPQDAIETGDGPPLVWIEEPKQAPQQQASQQQASASPKETTPQPSTESTPTAPAITETPVANSPSTVPVQNASTAAKATTETRSNTVDRSAKPPIKPPTKKVVEREQIVGWPMPEALLVEIAHLQKFKNTAAWAAAVNESYATLNQLEIVSDQSIPYLIRLGQLAQQLSDYSQQLATTGHQHHDTCSYLNEVSYRINRRNQIWLSVQKLARQQMTEKPFPIHNVVAQQISNRKLEINYDAIDPQWVEYLMLDKAENIFENKKYSNRSRQAIARRILARVTSISLTRQQARYAESVVGNDLGEMLRTISSADLDLGQFLVDVEKFETDPTSGNIAAVNRHFQNYYWSRDDQTQALADLIDDHFRNANIRIEFSQNLINRMLPTSAQTFHQPVADRIVGANVMGHSRITNQIAVNLVPDPNHLSFRLQSNGRVLSNTRAHARGFVFSNLGNALVNVSKQISIGETGVVSQPTDVRASSQERLTGIQSQLDGVPVVGWLARRMAQQQQQSQIPQARLEVENKLKREFRSRVDDQIKQQVQNGRNWVQTNILNPLHSMELEPTVVRLQTTDHAAVVRYRLAALDQNGADSPRPQAEPGSLLSFQLHRSAINNLINRVEIGGKEFTPETFMDHLNLILGRNDLQADTGQHQVKFKFASRDPIMLDFQNNNLQIALRLQRLQIGKRTRWKNLIVTAQYSPTAIDKHVFMEFDEQFGLQVTGERLRFADQVAVRTVFATLFQPKFDFPLLPPEILSRPEVQALGVTQMVMSNGWLGMSLNDVQPSAAYPGYHQTRSPVGQRR